MAHPDLLLYYGSLYKPHNNLDERLQRVKPLCYPPANLIRGKLSVYWGSELVRAAKV